MTGKKISRRHMVLGTAAAVLTPLGARAQDYTAPAVHRRNIMAFTPQRWQDHFDTLGKGAIVADIASRTLHFWSGNDATYKLYPSSVPRTEELTKRGYTQIVRKRVGPDWTPTPQWSSVTPPLNTCPPAPLIRWAPMRCI